MRWARLKLVTLLLVLGLPTTVYATVTAVFDRGALGGDDFIDWGDAGDPGTVLDSSFTVYSNGGKEVDVSELFPDFRRVDQGNGWDGNFAPGDHLLWTDSLGIDISFENPVSGAGLQLQPFALGPFTAMIDVYDADGNSLGWFSQDDGLSDSSADNSAIFLGVLSDAADISEIVYTVWSDSEDGNFAVNQLDIVSPVPVPEPAPFALMGSGLLGLVSFRLRGMWRHTRSLGSSTSRSSSAPC